MASMRKILRVNLTDSSIREEELNPENVAKFIGGSGLGAKILCDEVDPGVDPLSPDNKVVFAVGALTGTQAPCSGRYAVVFKSPLTGGYCDAHSGGHFPAELKFTGYEALIVEGASPKPVYLILRDGGAELRSADHLWGKNVFATTDAIQSELGEDVRVAAIGRAGEKQVRFACLMNDKFRAPARGGSGAVLGAKRLKAIAVRGTKQPPIADEKRFTAAAKQASAALRNFEGLAGLRDHGTASFVNPLNAFGVLPTRNYQSGVFEGAENISGETLTRLYLKKRTACFGCPLACGRWTRIEEGPYAGTEGEGPEYEALGGFGSLCGNSDLASVIRANYVANDYGMDIISCGNSIAFAMECKERGLLSDSDADGLKLDWGSGQSVVELVTRIGERSGLGALLSEGIKRAAETLGPQAEQIAQQVKGMETPMHDPRGYKGQGLAYATSNRGACHIRPYTGVHEVFGVAYPELGLGPAPDRFSEAGRGRMVKVWQDFANFVNALDVCQFVAIFPTLEVSHLVELFNGATGLELTAADALRAGERIHNLQRLFNVGAGFRRDTLPPRFLAESHASGPCQGQVVHLEPMLDEYYALRGWNSEGIPSPEKLAELGLTRAGQAG
ncbi:MAG: aldehyde ferredoxin oxidoreductase family protein [Deltaproteobacteria bacterium]|nr:aldehyde ferredoxin oxidoreductase family protein [Deltaproteobacteria bacterium]